MNFGDSLQALEFLAYLSNCIGLDEELVKVINDFKATGIAYKKLKTSPYEFNKTLQNMAGLQLMKPLFPSWKMQSTHITKTD